MAEKLDFFKHHKPPPTEEQIKHKAPVLPLCSNADDLDCLGIANPAWRDNGTVYCRVCAPPELKSPSRYLKDESHV